MSIDDLSAFLWASPTPEHAVERAAARLIEAGFVEWTRTAGDGADATSAGPPAPGRRFLRRAGSLLAWDATDADARSAFRIIGAHTDSPNLRLRPHPDRGTVGWRQLGIEVYGGVLLNSWLDRDLGVAGTAVIRDEQGSTTRQLFCIDRPVMRVPQLAIHLDRGVKDSGLTLNPNLHLHPVIGLGNAQPGDLARLVTTALDTGNDAATAADPATIVALDAMTFDLTRPALVGDRDELFASARLDNQLSCWAAIDALCAFDAGQDATNLASVPGPSIPVVALFDHEEVGSTSATGAASELLARTLRAIASGVAGSEASEGFAFDSMCARSSFLSVDNAHATHPNYPDRHEAHHQIEPGGGPALKINSNLRYATDVDSAAEVVLAAERAGVPLQRYSHRGDLPCGSTIGPTVSAALGMSTADVGAPQLSMHSAREMMAAADVGYLRALLGAWIGR